MNNLLLKLFLSKGVIFTLMHSLYTVPETRTVTVLIDTGLNITEKNVDYLCQQEHFDLTGTGLVDHYGHGTMMFNLITKDIDPAKNCVVLIKWCDKCTAYFDSNLEEKAAKAADMAQRVNPKFVNMSYGGWRYSYPERNSIQVAMDKGTTFSMAAGNDSLDLDENCIKYPACYFDGPRAHVLGALNIITGQKEHYSNYGKIITHWERVPFNGGTSSAAAIHTNKLMRGLIQ